MALENLRGTLDEAQAVMEECLGAFRPEVGLILGSGLGPLAERIADPVFVPFGEVPRPFWKKPFSRLPGQRSVQIGGSPIRNIRGSGR